MKSGYTWIDHTADAGVVVRARTLENLFEVAAEALTDLLTDREKISERTTVEIKVSAPEPELLLVRWLSEVLVRFDIEGFLFHRFAIIKMGNGQLVAHGFGETYDPQRHVFRTGVKAVTYHQLSIRKIEAGPQSDAGWEATIIFDI